MRWPTPSASGADRRPEQAFGDYFHGRHASCALGAAYEGMYRLPDDMEGRRPTKDLEEYFDVPGRHRARLPGRGLPQGAHAVGAHRPPERRPRWTREAIAAWVENGQHAPAAPASPDRRTLGPLLSSSALRSEPRSPEPHEHPAPVQTKGPGITGPSHFCLAASL